MAEEEGQEKELVLVNPRRDLMEQIIANDLENKAKEIEQGGGKREDLIPAEEAKAEAKAEAPAEEAPAPAEAETPAEPEKPAEKTFKIKVDGKEQEVPESKVIEFGIKTLQKETAADARLVEANKAREEANRLLAHVQNSQNPEPSKDAPKATGEDVKALAHAIQYGSEEEAAEALKKLKGNAGLTPEQAAAMVDERMEFRTAEGWYKRECKDIAEDPYLHRLFLDGERSKRQAGDNRPYLELYGDIVKEVRDWLGAKAPKQADPLAEKRVLKSQSVPQPAAASARKPAPQEQKEPTPKEVIAEMAATRGRSRQLPDAMRARR
jgi:hypothetical protein